MVRLLCGARPAVAFVCVFLTAGTATAQVVEQIGTRALGMGGAFVAVADDATASYWNPAGLATGAILSLLVERQTLARVPAHGGPDAHNVSEDGSGLIMSFGAPPLGLTYYRLRGSYVVRDSRAAGSDGDHASLAVASQHRQRCDSIGVLGLSLAPRHLFPASCLTRRLVEDTT